MHRNNQWILAYPAVGKLDYDAGCDIKSDGIRLKPPAKPSNESQRLHALQQLQLLSTPPEERFDRFTRIALRMFDVPFAKLSLVDDNQVWNKSLQGISLHAEPRAQSICGQTILGEDILVIPDVQLALQYADHVLYTTSGVRFYAGCPLRSLQGYNIGTLCVMDTRPRTLSPQDHKALRDLAAMIESELHACELSTTDRLTSLSNRRGLMQMAEKYLHYFIRHQLPATLALLELQPVTPAPEGQPASTTTHPRMAHEQGILLFAELLQSAGRHSDLLAKLEGNRFVFLLANTTLAQAEHFVDHLVGLCLQTRQKAALAEALDFTYSLVEFTPERPVSCGALLEAAEQILNEQTTA